MIDKSKELLWMGFNERTGFWPFCWGYTKHSCQQRIFSSGPTNARPVRVEIREVKKRKAVKRGKS
jgi:hypothetical protein